MTKLFINMTIVFAFFGHINSSSQPDSLQKLAARAYVISEQPLPTEQEASLEVREELANVTKMALRDIIGTQQRRRDRAKYVISLLDVIEIINKYKNVGIKLLKKYASFFKEYRDDSTIINQRDNRILIEPNTDGDIQFILNIIDQELPWLFRANTELPRYLGYFRYYTPMLEDYPKILTLIQSMLQTIELYIIKDQSLTEYEKRALIQYFIKPTWKKIDAELEKLKPIPWYTFWR